MTVDRWTCNICGEERPGDKISVAKHATIYTTGIRLEQNVRYCNDRPDCTLKAAHKTHTDLALERTSEALEESSELLYSIARGRLRLVTFMSFLAAVVGYVLRGVIG